MEAEVSEPNCGRDSMQRCNFTADGNGIESGSGSNCPDKVRRGATVPTQDTARKSDFISTIVAAHGTRWKTIWNRPNNVDLERKRQDSNVRYPGDIVTVLDRERKEQSCPTDNHPSLKRSNGLPATGSACFWRPAPRMCLTSLVAGSTISGSADGRSGLLRRSEPNSGERWRQLAWSIMR